MAYVRGHFSRPHRAQSRLLDACGEDRAACSRTCSAFASAESALGVSSDLIGSAASLSAVSAAMSLTASAALRNASSQRFKRAGVLSGVLRYRQIGFLLGDVGEARRMVERMQGACQPKLLLLRTRRPAHVRQEFPRLPKRVSGRRCGRGHSCRRLRPWSVDIVNSHSASMASATVRRTASTATTGFTSAA